MTKTTTKPKEKIKRKGQMLGGYVPGGILEGIETWIGSGTERDKSTFVREAARHLLKKEGIEFSENSEGVQ